MLEAFEGTHESLGSEKHFFVVWSHQVAKLSTCLFDMDPHPDPAGCPPRLPCSMPEGSTESWPLDAFSLGVHPDQTWK